MRHLTSHLANSSGRLDPHRDLIASTFESAARTALELLGAESIDVMFIASSEEAIPEMGVGGYTYGPNTIVVAIDPDSSNLSEAHLLSTLIHEFHHAMRWRGPGCGGNFGAMLVSEGLAQLFEEEVLGTPPIYSQVSISDSEVESARLMFNQEEFSHPKWFFGAEDIIKWFGYTFGYRLCSNYANSVGMRASELVDIPTREVLAFANFR